METCEVIRVKEVTHGKMSLSGDKEWTHKNVVTEKCSTPIFQKIGEDSSIKRKVCDSCLIGWSVHTNQIVQSAENKVLIEQEKEILRESGGKHWAHI